MTFSWHSVSDVIRVCRGNGMALGLMASQDYFLSKVSRLPSWISKPTYVSPSIVSVSPPVIIPGAAGRAVR